jgi:ubiquinone/menaquinone biosynthesis C-methylase UbiE
MNRVHNWYCRSDGWRNTMEQKLLPWVLGDADLGDDLLEVGPGPGMATNVLRNRVPSVTAIEIDPRFAASLSERMPREQVTVVEGDATAMPFESDRFSAAVCFTMLHHVPSPELQDRLLAEVHRVLRPGGRFLGSDSISSRSFEVFHWFDTLVPVDPDTFGERLESIGFTDVEIRVAPRTFRFRARRPQLN